MTPDWFSEVRPLIKEGVQQIVEQNDFEESDSSQTFHKLTSEGLFPNTEQFTVPAPGQYFQNELTYDEFYSREFEEPAEIIFRNLPDPTNSELSRSSCVESIERALFEFVGVVTNYAGSTRYDDVAFEAAFEEQFEPRCTDREFSRFIICLENSSIDPEVVVELSTGVNGSPPYLGPYQVTALRIRPLDELEETGIATYESPGVAVFDSVDSIDAESPNPALEIELQRVRPLREIKMELDNREMSPWINPEFLVTPSDGYPWEDILEVVRYLATGARRCLRLRDPKGRAGFAKGYYVAPGWQTFRGISTPVIFDIGFSCPSSSANTHIDGDRSEEIECIWDTHWRRIRPNNPKFEKPLARFERMFSRESYEDQLVDCVIGCENTLLKGGSPGANSYKLGIRAPAILGAQNSQAWSAEKVGKFFRKLYDLRNDVVHDDKALPKSPTSEAFIHFQGQRYLAPKFLELSRELYSDLLQEYMNQTNCQENSIEEINQYVDSKALEKGFEIHEQFP